MFWCGLRRPIPKPPQNDIPSCLSVGCKACGCPLERGDRGQFPKPSQNALPTGLMVHFATSIYPFCLVLMCDTKAWGVLGYHLGFQNRPLEGVQLGVNSKTRLQRGGQMGSPKPNPLRRPINFNKPNQAGSRLLRRYSRFPN